MVCLILLCIEPTSHKNLTSWPLQVNVSALYKVFVFVCVFIPPFILIVVFDNGFPILTVFVGAWFLSGCIVYFGGTETIFNG